MSTERQQKIELLARKNEGKREHPYFLTELSHALKQPLVVDDLVDLETTDDLFSRYDRSARHDDPNTVLKNRWLFTPSSRWIRFCFCLGEQLAAEQVALFAGPYRACGAVRTKAESALVNAPSILSFDGDTLRLQSLSSESGLYLDMFDENAARWIELKVWGKWYFRAKGCLAEDSNSLA